MSITELIKEAKARGSAVYIEGQHFRRVPVHICDETFVERRKGELQAKGLSLTGTPGAYHLAWN